MGIRIIGDKPSATVRLQPATGGVSIEGGDQPAISFRPVGEQRIVDVPDNDGESDVDGTVGSIDPTTVAADSNSGATPGKRRGRRPGSRNKSGGAATRSTTKTTDSIAAMLFTIHSVAASIIKVPALRIPKDGCKELAEAITEVTELYEIPLLNEKGMAWANLAAVATKVYIFDGKAAVVRDNVNQRVRVVSEPIEMPGFMTNGSGRTM